MFFAEKIFETKPSRWLYFACCVINSLFALVISMLVIPHYLIYIAFCAVLMLQFKFIYNTSYRQALFGSSVFFFHISSIHVFVTISLSLIDNVPPIDYFETPTTNFKSFFFTFVILMLVLVVFKKLVPTERIRRVSVSKTYSGVITITALLMITYITFDSYFLISNELYPELIIISAASTIFTTIIFYFLFLFSLNLVNLHVYKRKSDKAQNSYEKLVEKRNEMQEKLNLDALTGLYNRDFIHAKLDELCASDDIEFAVIFADIVALKYVNDTYGHDAGDRYITRVAAAIKASIRETDVSARVGGDEFLIILNDIDRQELTNVITRIKYNIERQNDLEEFLIRASIGCIYVESQDEHRNKTDILDIADRRMREDKSEFYNKMRKKL